MNAATIGAQLKEKYPQYAQYPDEVLGQRWLDVKTKKAGTTYTPNFSQPNLSGLSQTPATATPPATPAPSGFFDLSKAGAPNMGQTSNPNLFNNAVTTPGGVEIPNVPSMSKPMDQMNNFSVPLNTSGTGLSMGGNPNGLRLGGF